MVELLGTWGVWVAQSRDQPRLPGVVKVWAGGQGGRKRNQAGTGPPLLAPRTLGKLRPGPVGSSLLTDSRGYRDTTPLGF